MSKRGADVQGTKETGFRFDSGWDIQSGNMEQDAPKQATAAQMARRKIKSIRGRRTGPSAGGATGSGGAAPGSFSNPFQTASFNFGSAPSDQQPPSNGNIFGSSSASQSFPPAQAPGSFAFGGGQQQNASASFGGFGSGQRSPAPSFSFAPPQSSSFNFSAPSPFDKPASQDLSSSSFQGSIFNIGPTASSTPASSSLFSFSSSLSQSAAPSSTTAASSSTNKSAAPTSLFGNLPATSSLPPASSPSLFGNLTASSAAEQAKSSSTNSPSSNPFANTPFAFPPLSQPVSSPTAASSSSSPLKQPVPAASTLFSTKQPVPSLSPTVASPLEQSAQSQATASPFITNKQPVSSSSQTTASLFTMPGEKRKESGSPMEAPRQSKRPNTGPIPHPPNSFSVPDSSSSEASSPPSSPANSSSQFSLAAQALAAASTGPAEQPAEKWVELKKEARHIENMLRMEGYLDTVVAAIPQMEKLNWDERTGIKWAYEYAHVKFNHGFRTHMVSLDPYADWSALQIFYVVMSRRLRDRALYLGVEWAAPNAESLPAASDSEKDFFRWLYSEAGKIDPENDVTFHDVDEEGFTRNLRGDRLGRFDPGQVRTAPWGASQGTQTSATTTTRDIGTQTDGFASADSGSSTDDLPPPPPPAPSSGDSSGPPSGDAASGAESGDQYDSGSGGKPDSGSMDGASGSGGKPGTTEDDDLAGSGGKSAGDNADQEGTGGSPTGSETAGSSRSSGKRKASEIERNDLVSSGGKLTGNEGGIEGSGGKPIATPTSPRARLSGAAPAAPTPATFVAAPSTPVPSSTAPPTFDRELTAKRVRQESLEPVFPSAHQAMSPSFLSPTSSSSTSGDSDSDVPEPSSGRVQFVDEMGPDIPLGKLLSSSSDAAPSDVDMKSAYGPETEPSSGSRATHESMETDDDMIAPPYYWEQGSEQGSGQGAYQPTSLEEEMTLDWEPSNPTPAPTMPAGQLPLPAGDLLFPSGIPEPATSQPAAQQPTTGSHGVLPPGIPTYTMSITQPPQGRNPAASQPAQARPTPAQPSPAQPSQARPAETQSGQAGPSQAGPSQAQPAQPRCARPAQGRPNPASRCLVPNRRPPVKAPAPQPSQGSSQTSIGNVLSAQSVPLPDRTEMSSDEKSLMEVLWSAPYICEVERQASDGGSWISIGETRPYLVRERDRPPMLYMRHRITGRRLLKLALYVNSEVMIRASGMVTFSAEDVTNGNVLGDYRLTWTTGDREGHKFAEGIRDHVLFQNGKAMFKDDVDVNIEPNV